jgi:hypothetical protein
MADDSHSTPASVALTRKGERYAAAQAAAETPQDAPPPNVDDTLLARQRAAVERLEALAAQIVGVLDALGVDADFEPVLGVPELSPYWTSRPFRIGCDQTNWGEEGDVDDVRARRGRGAQPRLDRERVSRRFAGVLGRVGR